MISGSTRRQLGPCYCVSAIGHLFAAKCAAIVTKKTGDFGHLLRHVITWQVLSRAGDAGRAGP